MTTMFPSDAHNPVFSSLPPTDPTPPPGAVSYFHPHVCKDLVMGGGGSVLPKVLTCHRLGIRGGVGSLPLESLSFFSHGVAQSGYRGWYVSSPAPHIPPLDTQWTWTL